MSEKVELCHTCRYLLEKGISHPKTGAILCDECREKLDNAVRALMVSERDG